MPFFFCKKKIIDLAVLYETHILSILSAATLQGPRKFPVSTTVPVLAYLSSYLKIAIDTAVAGDSTSPRAIPLAMSTMKNETLGTHNFYAWFSSVSPISIGMGLRSLALRAGETPLKKHCQIQNEFRGRVSMVTPPINILKWST